MGNTEVVLMTTIRQTPEVRIELWKMVPAMGRSKYVLKTWKVVAGKGVAEWREWELTKEELVALAFIIDNEFADDEDVYEEKESVTDLEDDEDEDLLPRSLL